MKVLACVFFSLFVFPSQLSAGERDPNLYDFENDAKLLIFTCKKDRCDYYDEGTQLTIPLLKNWAIEEPFYYQTAGGFHANVPSINYVDTKSGLWIRQNPRQIMQTPDFVKCDEFSYQTGKDYFTELICLSQAKVDEEARRQGKAMMKKIKQWRLHRAAKRLNNAHKLAKQNLKRYTGNYFSVLYPADFTAKPAMKQQQGRWSADTDEARFNSADGTVEFFVYSPLWSGKPENYLKQGENEELLSEDAKKTFKKKAYRNYIVNQWRTFRAKDGSYLRSYVAQRACHDDGNSSFSDCTSKVSGIKYKDQQTYEKYKPAYLKFKQSLEQYAD